MSKNQFDSHSSTWRTKPLPYPPYEYELGQENLDFSKTPTPGAFSTFPESFNAPYPSHGLYNTFDVTPPEASLLKFSRAEPNTPIREFATYDEFLQIEKKETEKKENENIDNDYLLQFNFPNNKNKLEPSKDSEFKSVSKPWEAENLQLRPEGLQNTRRANFTDDHVQPNNFNPSFNLYQQQNNYQQNFYQQHYQQNYQLYQQDYHQHQHHQSVVNYNPNIVLKVANNKTLERLAPVLSQKLAPTSFPRKPRRKTGPYKRNELYSLLSTPSNFVTPVSLANLQPKAVYYFPNINVFMPPPLKHDPHAVLKLLNFPIGSYSQSTYRDGNGEFLLRQARCKGGKVCVKCGRTYGSKRVTCSRGCKKKLKKLPCSITVYYLYPKDTSGMVSSRLLVMLPDAGENGHSHELD